MCENEVEIFEGERKALDDEVGSGRPSASQTTTVLKWTHWLKETGGLV